MMKQLPSVKMTEGRTPNSIPSRIVARTLGIVSGIMMVYSIRDLFFSGTILEFIPRDDIYLEWTNAFLHSPPEGSPEAFDHGLESSFYIGDKFVSQLYALHVLISIGYKISSTFLISCKHDGSGIIQSKMIWKSLAAGDGMFLFTMRLFTSAAQSAGFDMRWHLMCLGYETFILILYAFF